MRKRGLVRGNNIGLVGGEASDADDGLDGGNGGGGETRERRPSLEIELPGRRQLQWLLRRPVSSTGMVQQLYRGSLALQLVVYALGVCVFLRATLLAGEGDGEPSALFRSLQYAFGTACMLWMLSYMALWVKRGASNHVQTERQIEARAQSSAEAALKLDELKAGRFATRVFAPVFVGMCFLGVFSFNAYSILWPTAADECARDLTAALAGMHWFHAILLLVNGCVCGVLVAALWCVSVLNFASLDTLLTSQAEAVGDYAAVATPRIASRLQQQLLERAQATQDRAQARKKNGAAGGDEAPPEKVKLGRAPVAGAMGDGVTMEQMEAARRVMSLAVHESRGLGMVLERRKAPSTLARVGALTRRLRRVFGLCIVSQLCFYSMVQMIVAATGDVRHPTNFVLLAGWAWTGYFFGMRQEYYAKGSTCYNPHPMLPETAADQLLPLLRDARRWHGRMTYVAVAAPLAHGATFAWVLSTMAEWSAIETNAEAVARCPYSSIANMLWLSGDQQWTVALLCALFVYVALNHALLARVHFAAYLQVSEVIRGRVKSTRIARRAFYQTIAAEFAAWRSYVINKAEIEAEELAALKKRQARKKRLKEIKGAEAEGTVAE